MICVCLHFALLANEWNCKRLDVSFNHHKESLFDLPVHSKILLEDFLLKNMSLIKEFTVSIINKNIPIFCQTITFMFFIKFTPQKYENCHFNCLCINKFLDFILLCIYCECALVLFVCLLALVLTVYLLCRLLQHMSFLNMKRQSKEYP